MKKLLVIIAATLLMTMTAAAQPRAIGARFNGFFGPGVEVAYQHATPSGDQFFDTGVSFGFGTKNNPGFGMNVAAVYDWIFAKPGIFEFYAGPGASLMFLAAEGGFFAPGICGEIGAQINVAQHFAVGVNYRPGVHFVIGNGGGVRGGLTNAGISFLYRW